MRTGNRGEDCRGSGKEGRLRLRKEMEGRRQCRRKGGRRGMGIGGRCACRSRPTVKRGIGWTGIGGRRKGGVVGFDSEETGGKKREKGKGEAGERELWM